MSAVGGPASRSVTGDFVPNEVDRRPALIFRYDPLCVTV
jgi:hypothetical protein